MKTATIPAVRVEPEFRAEVEALLNADESLSEFVERAVRDSVRLRSNQLEFIARGLASLKNAQNQNTYVDADAVISTLERKLNQAKASVKPAHRTSRA
jgi:predicted transcriptional regulator